MGHGYEEKGMVGGGDSYGRARRTIWDMETKDKGWMVEGIVKGG